MKKLKLKPPKVKRFKANTPIIFCPDPLDYVLVITSNFDLDGLQRRLSGKDSFAAVRITSRLEEMCIQAFLGTNGRRRKS